MKTESWRRHESQKKDERAVASVKKPIKIQTVLSTILLASFIIELLFLFYGIVSYFKGISACNDIIFHTNCHMIYGPEAFNQVIFNYGIINIATNFILWIIRIILLLIIIYFSIKKKRKYI